MAQQAQQAPAKKVYQPRTLAAQKFENALANAGVKVIKSKFDRQQRDNKAHQLGFDVLTRMAELYGDNEGPNKTVGARELKKGLCDLAIGLVNQIDPQHDAPFTALCDVTGHKPSPLLEHEFKGKKYFILSDSDKAFAQEVLRDVFPTEYKKLFGEATEAVADAAKTDIVAG